MSEPKTSKVAKAPLVVFGVMTVLTFGGPFVVKSVLQGGAKTSWPPDRPIEWYVLVATCSLVLFLMAVLLVINFRIMKSIKTEVAKSKTSVRGGS